MCTKTKTSYGCGHTFKLVTDCSRHCQSLEKYHFVRDGDCRDCKRGGAQITRGKEGKGRYAQELKQRESPTPPPTPLSRPPLTPLSPLSSTFKPSPWAPPNWREKNWDRSPVRRLADDAWLREHDRRQRDLEARSHENSSRTSPSSPADQDFLRSQRRRDEDAARLRAEIRHIEEAEKKSRARRRADRSNSYDSFESMDSGRSVPRGRSHDSRLGLRPHQHRYPLALPYRGLGDGLDEVVGSSSRRWERH